VDAGPPRASYPPRLHPSPTLPRPFLLRRIKTDVETSLPSKKEILLYAQMTALQKKLDKQLRDKTLQVRRVMGWSTSPARVFLLSIRFRRPHSPAIFFCATTYGACRPLLRTWHPNLRTDGAALVRAVRTNTHSHSHALTFSP
jgi:hypothetical protein